MAKITARGATEVRRFTTNGTTYLLRSDGAVLRRLLPGDGYTVIARGWDRAKFESNIEGRMTC